MFGRYLGAILFISVNGQAFFDPTIIAKGSQLISGVVGGLDQAAEVADLGFSLQDLLSDLGAETSSEDEINEAVKKLEDLNLKARDLRWNHTELKEALQADLSQGKSIKTRIQAIRTMISASKKIAAIVGIRPETGKRAVQIQSIRINSMILEELQEMRRAQYLSYLEDRQAKARRNILLEEIAESRNKRSVGNL